MADGEQDGGDGLGSGRQPLPPEIPATGPADAPARQPLPSEPPSAEGSGWEWWRAADVRDELRDTWAVEGSEALDAVREIGAQIGEVVAAHLPDPYAAAQRRGLDLRWLHLGVNLPALALSVLVTWGGQSSESRMTHYVEREGLFAPLGWVLLPALVLAVLMVLPFGGVLGSAVGGLVSAATRGVLVLCRRAWGVPYVGYLLRLVVAVAVWSFAIAAGRLSGLIVINWLTGVSS